MEIGGYKLELVKRFEPAMNAAFARKGDGLLVATRGESEYTLVLLDLRKFKNHGPRVDPGPGLSEARGRQRGATEEKAQLEGPRRKTNPSRRWRSATSRTSALSRPSSRRSRGASRPTRTGRASPSPMTSAV
jgi:hypothetical protein